MRNVGALRLLSWRVLNNILGEHVVFRSYSVAIPSASTPISVETKGADQPRRDSPNRTVAGDSTGVSCCFRTGGHPDRPG